MTDDPRSNTIQVPGTDDDPASYIDEVAARAAGAAPDFLGAEGSPPAPPTIADARRHLDEAWLHSDAGTDVPAEARMRQVKKAMLLAMRPVTSHQIQFNQQLSVAVKELAVAVDSMVRRVDGAGTTLDAATTRVHAALATVEVTVDDLLGGLSRLETVVADLAVRTESLEADLAAERAELRTLRARQDIVLRNAGAALAPKAEKRRLAALAGELDQSAELLSDDLADMTRGSRDEVRADVSEFLDVVSALGGPVVDLGVGRGEWLEVLQERGIDAVGVDTSGRVAAAAARRGLDARRADPIAFLAGLAESSVACITGFGLVERIGSDALLELLDRALGALRPGGLLILSAANPTAIDVGASEVWLDPARRRPVHPQLLEMVTLSRGFGETEVRWMRPLDDSLLLRPDDLAGLASARAAVLVERLNRVLAGPRGYAVLARKAGAGAGVAQPG